MTNLLLCLHLLRLHVLRMTIFILPARLKLLHFKKSQLPLVAHALIKACLLSDTTECVPHI